MTVRMEPRSLLGACHKALYDRHVPLRYIQERVTPGCFSGYVRALTDGTLHAHVDSRLNDRPFRARARTVRMEVRSVLRRFQDGACKSGIYALGQINARYQLLIGDVCHPLDQLEIFWTEHLLREAEALEDGHGTATENGQHCVCSSLALIWEKLFHKNSALCVTTFPRCLSPHMGQHHNNFSPPHKPFITFY